MYFIKGELPAGVARNLKGWIMFDCTILDLGLGRGAISRHSLDFAEVQNTDVQSFCLSIHRNAKEEKS